MKKAILLCAGLGVAATASAQTTLTQIFKTDVGGALTFHANDGSTRGLSFNPATGNLVVADRTPNNTVYVVNGTTGAQVAQLQDGGLVTGGSLALMKVRADASGKIYASNLSSVPASTFKLYSWANETPGVDPTVFTIRAGGSSYSSRVGDAMDLTGSGATLKMAFTGSAATEIVVLTDTDINGTFEEAIATMGSALVGTPNISFDPDNNGVVWIHKSETTDDALGFDINLSDGSAGAGADQAAIMGAAADGQETTAGPCAMAKVGSSRFWCLGPSATSATSLTAITAKVFPEDSTTASFTTGSLQGGTLNANGNGSGDVCLTSTGNLYVLATNNSISGWSGVTGSVSAVSDWNLYAE